ncbi:hypothetical protein QBC47DRAFT_311471 [Echria macrotheca]|uniref:Protein kinase domain-containing protein n=1 Tax=Echria macrotheca TaxID=438768 RepID=A0AAJ0B119_9PEZI|nr:hypothetical protein QBC47DRAFT_311471 [Echria macrotheca]
MKGPRGGGDEVFIPKDELARVLDSATVQPELKRCLTQFRCDSSALTEYVVKYAPKTFSALVFGGGTKFIAPLHRAGFQDDQLPVSRDAFEEAIQKGMKDLENDGGYTDMMDDEDELEAQVEAQVHSFAANNQWLFTAPIFGGKQFGHKLHAKTRLPFLPIDPAEMKTASGGFGKVQERVIHKSHLELSYQNFNGQLHPRIAEKELTKPTDWDTNRHNKEAKKEADNLQAIRELNHDHLIKAIAYYVQDGRHVFLFPFAEDGNLRQHWQKADPGLKLGSRQLEWTLRQLAGLAEAVQALHKENCRHGDLKPENILCFRKGKDGVAVHAVCFVIADVGLAKMHNDITALRDGKTTTMGRTMMYSPPELEFRKDTPRSRLFDIWSLGCIFLECVVWLVYGKAGLGTFQDEMGGYGQRGPFYAPTSRTGTNSGDVVEARFEVHPAVTRWAERLRERRCCSEGTALRTLVDLIMDKMLVVATPNYGAAVAEELGRKTSRRLAMPQATPQVFISPPTVGQEPSAVKLRATSSEIHDAFQDILKGIESGTLHITPNSEGQGPIPGSLLTASGNPSRAGGLTANRNPLVNDSWEYTPDATLAREVFQSLNTNTVLPRSMTSPLCARCKGLELLSLECKFSDTVSGLRSTAERGCALCRLLLSWCNSHPEAAQGVIKFFRAGARLAAVGSERVGIATLCVTAADRQREGLQLGFPSLPEPGSASHINVLSRWLVDCDEKHACFPEDIDFLPTRLIDVGAENSSTVRLVCNTTGLDRKTKYIALSHRWGKDKPLKTETKNIEGLSEWVIDFDGLPKTFRHAVQVTRSLGLGYLWIDSLCIVQDDVKDWERESQRMEEVFSSAYCTIAATCASGTNDGFLKQRTERQVVAMKDTTSGLSFYACEAINDFGGDVDSSVLNNRGWVLQERALARRTVHFTETQTYWECGKGVRCETMTKMKNEASLFLGDSNFPEYAVFQSEGKKIKLVQSLYEKYSKMDLTYNEDRPIAIRGLEARLIQTVGGPGGFGVFEKHLHRYLLWQRTEKSLTRIKEFPNGPVPSWSWMAWDGAIEYMDDIPGNQVEWQAEVQWRSPMSRSEKIEQISEYPFLTATVREFSSPAVTGIKFDDGRTDLSPGCRCVVLGVSKPQPGLGRGGDCYVLAVADVLVPDGNEKDTYWQRLGVGKVRREDVAWEKPSSAVLIR